MTQKTSFLKSVLKTILLMLTGSLLVSHGSAAEINKLSCPQHFANNMVLQRDMNVPIWGQGKAKSSVTVTFAGQTKTTTAGTHGSWRVILNPLKTSTENRPLTITSADETLTFNNILVGEVWLASGQSNMEWPINKTPKYKEQFPDLDKSLIRAITVMKEASLKPKGSVEGHWVQLDSPESAKTSAVASYFAMNLLQELHVPIGIISTSWGRRCAMWPTRSRKPCRGAATSFSPARSGPRNSNGWRAAAAAPARR